jgi:hypothetical protein
MLWNVSVIKGYAVTGNDGLFGTASDFLFDDASWKMRWLVVETGDWYSGREALIPISVLGRPDPALRRLPVSLTMQQAQGCPNIEQDLPFSRQAEASFSYHGRKPYRARSCFDGALEASFVPSPQRGEARVRDPRTATPPGKTNDHHLRSVEEIIGYHVHATDGEIGHVDDFLAEETGWQIRSIKVNTRNWIPGARVLVSPQSVSMIAWFERLVFLDVERQKVRHGPPYDPLITVDGRYTASLSRLYDDRWSLP